MKSDIPSMQTLLQNYFLQPFLQQRKVSPETTHSYRDTFHIYLSYMRQVHQLSPAEVGVEHFDLEYVQGFCKYLEDIRGNKPVIINNRIAAIKSLMHYVSKMEPEYSAIAKHSLMLPAQKQHAMDFITKEELDAMITICDTTTFIGPMDKLMLMIFYNSGVRVSELLVIKQSDIQRTDSGNHANLKIFGKGRKQRVVPFWKATASYIGKYIETYSLGMDNALFLNKYGDMLTCSGVRTQINAIVSRAIMEAPSLSEKNIAPHTFCHSVAMNLLTLGVDISTITIWLGHSSVETTHKYMVADMELKRKSMEKAGSAGNDSYHYKPHLIYLTF